MNCKQGDLAFVVGGSIYAGRIVECLYLAPKNQTFRLPDGHLHEILRDDDPMWIVRLIGSAVDAPVGNGMRKSFYGAGSDKRLRPIRPGELDETTDTDLKIKEPA